MHCFVHLHGTFKVRCRRSWHFSSRSTFPQSLWGCVTCFTIEVGNSSSNSKTKNIANYTHQEGNIMELLLTRHCFMMSRSPPWVCRPISKQYKSRDDTSRCANVIVYYIRIGLHNNRIYWYVSCIIRFLCLYLKVEIVR